MTGVLPHKTSLQLRSPDGSIGTVPAASEQSAGCMTAEQVRMLNVVWTWHQTSAGTGAPVIIEQAADTSHLLSKQEARELLARMPRALDATPQIAALRQQVTDLSHRLSSQGAAALSQHPASGEVVDATARHVLEGVITQFEALDARVARLETMLRSIEQMAEVKAA